MIKMIRLYDIDWETDGEDINLPNEVKVHAEDIIAPRDMDNLEDCLRSYDEEFADYLSDEYGFLVNGFRVEITSADDHTPSTESFISEKERQAVFNNLIISASRYTDEDLCKAVGTVRDLGVQVKNLLRHQMVYNDIPEFTKYRKNTLKVFSELREAASRYDDRKLRAAIEDAEDYITTCLAITDRRRLLRENGTDYLELIMKED